MRTSLALSLAFATALSTLSACATTGHGASAPINVAVVRHEIADTIRAQAGDRAITSMGRVTADRAVVFTSLRTGGRQEEAWVKHGGQWTLDKATAMDGTGTASRAAL